MKNAQAANYISVRQRPSQDGGWGTLRQPKQFELGFAAPQNLSSRLGYEAVPATEFWQFRVKTSVRLKVDRISQDRYACHVGVALLDSGHRRVAALVQSASGDGASVNIAPGSYIIAASLGMPVLIRELTFRVSAVPIAATMATTAMLGVGNTEGALLSAEESGAAQAFAGFGVDVVIAAEGSFLTVDEETPHVAFFGMGEMGFGEQLCGENAAELSCLGSLHEGSVQQLHGVSQTGAFSSAGSLAAVEWLDRPLEAWHCRLAAGVVELNSAYVSFSGTANAVLAQLEELASILSSC